MTAEELYQIVKDHPEAWPEGIRWAFSRVWHAPSITPGGEQQITTDLAVLAFEASGMRLVCAWGCSVHRLDGTWRVRIPKANQDDLSETDLRYNWTIAYPTALEAIYAAIAAVKGADHAT